MGTYDLALPVMRECLETCRRLLGSQHPDTHQSAGDLGKLSVKMRDDPAAAPLLQEAVQGLTAVYSAEHRLVLHYQSGIDALTERQAATAAVGQPAAPAAGEHPEEGRGDGVPAHGEAQAPRVG